LPQWRKKYGYTRDNQNIRYLMNQLDVFRVSQELMLAQLTRIVSRRVEKKSNLVVVLSFSKFSQAYINFINIDNSKFVFILALASLTVELKLTV